MHVNRADLADFTYFLAIARHRSFRRAGLELGVTASALSHALKGLEARLGVRLLNRTNRSVTLTAAGEDLQKAISGPLDLIGQAVEGLNVEFHWEVTRDFHRELTQGVWVMCCR